VNKPYLPLASGEFSPALGQGLVLLSGALALAIGACCRLPGARGQSKNSASLCFSRTSLTFAALVAGYAVNSPPLMWTLVARCGVMLLLAGRGCV
jgi:hypothetical protein